jgi:hypothetical protein
MLSIWTEPSGYTFTNNGQPFLEQVVVSIPLPVTTTAGITFTIISGSLPGGLQLSGADITGTPFIISNLVTYQFCIRASNGVDFSDRTFLMQVNGANPPVFVTAAGELPVGVHNQLYAYDETYVSYQIKAFDVDTALGTNLSYFIASDDGVLPPGLTLGPTGLISGFILQNPLTQITPSDGSGAFDDTFFDDAGYDFALIPTNGYDSYQYDDVTWDYSSPTQLPSSLNQNYQFKITVTDGVRFNSVLTQLH